MRDPARIDPMLELLGAVWKQNPDWRLGQLICNATGLKPSPIFNVEDNRMAECIRSLRDA